MRIISGIYRGREIVFAGEKTRPLTTKLRCNIFNIMQGICDIKNITVCDICAGTGSFGLESLSRGAKFVYFIEKNRNTALDIMRNLKAWNISNAKVINKDILYSPRIYDCINLFFLDPPFGHNLVEKILCNIKTRYNKGFNLLIIVRSDYEIQIDDTWLMILRVYRTRESIVYFLSNKNHSG